MVGSLPVVPGHRGQRGDDHLGAGHGLQRELGIRPVLRGLEPRQAGRGVPVHPGLLPAQRDDDLRIPPPSLRAGEPGDRVDLLFHHAPGRVGGAAHRDGGGGGPSDGLVAPADDRHLRGRLDRLHRDRRGEGDRVDQRVPGADVPRRGRGHACLSGLADRRRVGCDRSRRGRRRTPQRLQLGSGARRQRLLAPDPERSEHRLGRPAERLHWLDGRVRNRSRPDAAAPDGRDPAGEPAHAGADPARHAPAPPDLPGPRRRSLHVLHAAPRAGARAQRRDPAALRARGDARAATGIHAERHRAGLATRPSARSPRRS